jgi:hypothetical protein
LPGRTENIPDAVRRAFEKSSNGCGVFFEIKKGRRKSKEDFLISWEENKFYFLFFRKINLFDEAYQVLARGRGDGRGCIHLNAAQPFE